MQRLAAELLNVIAKKEGEANIKKISFARKPLHINMDQVKSLFFSHSRELKGRVQEDLTSVPIEEQYETINPSVSYLPFWFNVFLSVPVYLKAALTYVGVPCSS